MTISATEPEHDEFAARERVRKIATAALDRYLKAMLSTPPGQPCFVEDRFDDVRDVVIPAVRQYRARLK